MALKTLKNDAITFTFQRLRRQYCHQIFHKLDCSMITSSYDDNGDDDVDDNQDFDFDYDYDFLLI